MSDQNIAIRLKFLIDELGISNSQFADECNISRPTLSQLVTGRNKKVSDVLISQIHKAYPDLSILWLLFGEGDIWNTKPPVENSVECRNDDGNFSTDDSEDKYDDSIRSIDINCGASESKNASNFLENPIVRKEGSEYSKEKALNSDDLQAKKLINSGVDSILKNPEILSDLAKFKEKSKKVVQITIYYDDSTFETFYPGK